MTNKKTGSWRALVAAACLVTVLGSATWVLTDQGINRAEAEYPIQAALPGAFLGHFSLDGVAGGKGCRELALAQLMEEPQMKGFLDPLGEMLQGMIDQEVAPMLEDIGLTVDDLKALAGGGITVTVVDVKFPEDGPPDVDALITIDAGKNPELIGKIQKIVAKMLEDQMGVHPETIDLGGMTATRANIEGIDVFWTGIGRYLLLGTKSRTLVEVATRLKSGSRAGGMLENEAAVAAWHTTAPTSQAVAWSYVDVARCMKVLDASPLGSEPEVGLVLSMLGLDSIQNVAYGVSFEGRAIVDRMWVGAPRGLEGIYAGMVRSDKPLATVAMAPRGCWAYEGIRFDLDVAIKELRRGMKELDEDIAHEIDSALAEADEQVGFSIVDDFIPSLGPEMGGWIASAPFGGLIPEMMVAMELRDADKFHACLGKAAASHGEVVRSFEFMGRKIGYFDLGRMINEPGEFGFGLKPSWMVQDGFVLFALAPQTLKNYLAADNRQRPSLASHPDFDEAARHFRSRYPNAGSVGTAFLNTGELMAMAIDTAMPIMQSVHMPAEVPVDMTLLPTTDVFRRHLFGVTALSTSTNGGFAVEIYSPTGYLSGMALVGGVFGAVGWMTVRETEAAAMEWEEWPEEEIEEEEPEEMEEEPAPDKAAEEPKPASGGGGR